jgi:nucleotide-binding universal stress UspA family protein
VLVVGEYKKGKSALVNALVNSNICPVDDDIATSVPTAVRFAKAPVAIAIREADKEGEQPERKEIPVQELASFVSESGNSQNEKRLLSVEVGIPRELLSTGLILVDTPGVGGLASAHSAATYAALPAADAVMFVSDASQEYTAPEIDFLRTAREVCPNLFGVLTKVDFYPEWRKIYELDRQHLQRAGLTLGLLPISTVVRYRALQSNNPQLDAESGYRQLLEYLAKNVIQNGERLAIRSAVHDQLSVISQLESTFVSERDALKNPENGPALVAALKEAKERAARLRSDTARWQQTLGDGIADVTSEVDFDLKGRLRTLGQEVDEYIDSLDPGETWSQIEEWLQQRVSYEISQNYLLMAQMSKELAERVADHFAMAEAEITASASVDAPTTTVAAIELTVKVPEAKRRIAGSVLTILRGSYSGTSLLSMVGNVAGFVVATPVTVGLGLLMGGKALKDERQKALAGRRQQAKTAHRKYVDEVTFQVGKHSRDTLRKVQRDLRDQFTSLAEELQRSTAETLDAAQKALQLDVGGRQQRMTAVIAELQRLAGLRQRVVSMAPELAPAATATG